MTRNPHDRDPGGATGRAPLPSGGHHCLIYGDTEEVRRVALPFVEEGIRLGRRVLVIGPAAGSNAIAALARDLRSERPDVLQSGQVAFLTNEECFHRKWGFDRVKALSFVADQISQARDDGFEGLHLVQEGGRFRPDGRGLRDLAAYEAGLTVFLRNQPCTVLCIYDRWNTAPNVLLRCLDLHPTELGEGLAEGPNPYFRPEVELKEVRWDHVVEERLRFLKWLRERPSDAGHPTSPLLLRVLRKIDDREGSIEGMLEGAVEELCRHLGARAGRAYMVDRDEEVLIADGEWEVREGAPSATPVAVRKPSSLARGQGLPGRAWVVRRPVWVTDLLADRELGRESGDDLGPWARAATALPLMAGGIPVAVLLFLFPEVREPDEALLDEMEPVARSLGEALGRIRAEAALTQTREGLDHLMEASGDGVVTMDGEGRIRSWNWAAARLLGHEAEGIPEGRPFADFLPADSRGRFQRALVVAAAQGEADLAGGTVELRSFRLGSEGTPVKLTLTCWDAAAGGTFVGVLKDLAEHREAETRDRIIESVVSSSAREAMVVTTANLTWGGPCIVYANRAFCRMTGYKEPEVRGRSVRDLTGPGTDEEALQRVWGALARGESVTTEFLAYRKDGEEFLMGLELSPVRDARGRVSHFIGVQTDVTEERIVEEALKRADQDPLTGLANKSLFNKMLRRAIERSAKTPELRYAVLFLDMDGFKAINDTFGHLLGDKLLVAVARALEGAIRPGDVLARFGGDEFVILVEFVGGLKDVLTVAERVKDRFTRPFQVEGRGLRVGSSIGITLSEARYSSPEEVLRDADAAMYRAKDEGDGSYRIFDPELQEAAASAGRIRTELESSLERGEFSLHYQPLMELASSRIAGLELLLRWDHPVRGLVPAGEFIAQAEDMELIVPLGRWVVREACRQLRRWQSQFPAAMPLVLSVNLSPRELLDPRLPGWFRRSLEETGADPGSLLVEIPEGFFARRHPQISEVLEPLQRLGVRIGIDGFGTGRSSLAQLYRFPVDLLKIDRSLVAGLPTKEAMGLTDLGGRAVRSMLALGESLGMQVVAKGVETSHQRRLLRDLSCRLAQGYLFSEPVDAAQAEIFLKAGRIANGDGGEAG
jgi:diguanylate cyclase (GGDEF)-like protein/PAS domain S-box-containing protein